MIVVLQRVREARVRVEGAVVGAIGPGLLLLVGIEKGDTEGVFPWVAEKLAHLRVFNDGEGKMNRSILEVGGEFLAVSQFTLAGDVRKGRRPGFDRAERPEGAAPLFARFVEVLRDTGVPVATGVFGAMMEVELVNDGPVTLILERRNG